MADWKIVIDGGRCDRCGDRGGEGELGEELNRCPHGVKHCGYCFFFNQCPECAPNEIRRGREPKA